MVLEGIGWRSGQVVEPEVAFQGRLQGPRDFVGAMRGHDFADTPAPTASFATLGEVLA